MWDHPEFDDAEDDWEPLRHRRAGPIRILAVLVVIAMVLALVIPVLLRALQDEPDEPRPDGVRAAVVVEDRSPTTPGSSSQADQLNLWVRDRHARPNDLARIRHLETLSRAHML